MRVVLAMCLMFSPRLALSNQIKCRSEDVNCDLPDIASGDKFLVPYRSFTLHVRLSSRNTMHVGRSCGEVLTPTALGEAICHPTSRLRHSG